MRYLISDFRIALLLGAGMFLTQGASGADEAQKLKDILTGDARGSASSNPQCAMFSQTEIAAFLGQSVQSGENAVQGLGCQWVSSTDDADAMIMVIPSRCHERPGLAPGFKPLAEPGTNGFVVPEMGGWAAGTVLGEKAIKVSLSGPRVTEQSVLSLLREVAKRSPRALAPVN